jgi:hypothetical protein
MLLLAWPQLFLSSQVWFPMMHLLAVVEVAVSEAAAASMEVACVPRAFGEGLSMPDDTLMCPVQSPEPR